MLALAQNAPSVFPGTTVAAAQFIKAHSSCVSMKPHRSLLLVLAATLSAPALVPSSAASKAVPAIAYAVHTATAARSGYEKILRGVTPGTVQRALGSPRPGPSPEVWIYHHFHADLPLANAQGCETLIVIFTQGRVTDMKLVNSAAERLAVANPPSALPGLFASRP